MTDNQKQDKPKHRRSPGRILWNITKLLFLFLIMGTFFSGGAVAGYVASLVKDDPVRSFEEVSDKVFTQSLTGFAYFNDKELIGQLRAEEDRRLVKKDEVSAHLINAIIATEDKHFYEHRGFDPIGTARAALEGVTGSSIQTGGSTITQQLIKQTILSPKVSHERKAKEIFLALRMERMFSKDQILEAYMNEMYFGHSANKSNIYGVQAAAKGIFGKDVKDLNIPEAAYIAGMLQAPSRYIPFDKDGLEAGLNRQKVVLNRMLENGYITESQKQEALNYDIAANLAESKPRAYNQYPFLMMEIEERAARVLVDQELEKDPNLAKIDLSRQEYREMVDKKRKEILRGGYHIYTTIDKDIYEMMTAIAEKPENFGPNRNYKVRIGSETREVKNALEEIGATLIDNKTGAILGFIGGRDFKVQQVNHTTRPRQPGSAMKPLAAYAPAFELGLLQPGSAIDDAPIALENGAGRPPHYPSNWNNKFQGLVTSREALKWSYNIPAIKAYLQVGIPQALGFVERMGITTLITPEDNPRVNDFQAKTGVIGGLTQGTTVEEITNAYSVFPNQGSFIDAYLINKIENTDSETIFEHSVTPQAVYSEQTSYLITDMMRTVVKQGTGASVQRLTNGNRDIAGKTGTTNDDVDSWFVGYTPDVTLGVWIGYDIPYRLPRASTPRSMHIWSKVMNGVFELYPEKYPSNSKFVEPPGIVRRSVCSDSGKLPSSLCQEAGKVITELFNQKYVPTEVDDIHVKAKIVTYNGKVYLAKEETPDDMIQEKIGVKASEAIKLPSNPERYKMSFQTLDWKNRLPSQTDPRVDDGGAPSEPKSVSVQDSGTLVWASNPEPDIVGYRIYRSSGQKTGVVLQSDEKGFKVTDKGLYYVTAVDVSGKESAPSKTVGFGVVVPPTDSVFPDLGIPQENDQEDNENALPLDPTKQVDPKSPPKQSTGETDNKKPQPKPDKEKPASPSNGELMDIPLTPPITN